MEGSGKVVVKKRSAFCSGRISSNIRSSGGGGGGGDAAAAGTNTMCIGGFPSPSQD